MTVMRVGFLFNHEGLHQIAHTLPIAAALARLRPDFHIEVMTGSTAAEDEVRRGLPACPPNLAISRLAISSRWLRLAARLASAVAPLERIAVLGSNVERFRRLDALVVPEVTSLMLKTRFGLNRLTIIHAEHGAGDRAIAFTPIHARFDFLLLPGAKNRDRLQEKGYLKPGRYAVTGYPKFDGLRDAPEPPRFFENGRPTILYNPHPSPRLSSWFRMGRQVLEFFRRSERYNLIFAPHVMLFKRRFTATIDPPALAPTGRVAKRYRECPHIIVDTQSRALVDMTYTRAADIYLGDVSSQIYEFLLRPRPAVFLNPHGFDHTGDPDFAHWQCGPVVQDITDLDAALEATRQLHPTAYLSIQHRLFDYSFDLASEPAAARGAEAISRFLCSGKK